MDISFVAPQTKLRTNNHPQGVIFPEEPYGDWEALA